MDFLDDKIGTILPFVETLMYDKSTNLEISTSWTASFSIISDTVQGTESEIINISHFNVEQAENGYFVLKNKPNVSRNINSTEHKEVYIPDKLT